MARPRKPAAMPHTKPAAMAPASTPLMLVACCAFASMASMRICDAMLPALATEFDASTGRSAQTISAFALAYGVLQLFYGPLGDRYGKVRVIGWATLACTFGSIVASLAPTLDMLIMGRILSGAAAAGIIPLTMAWIGDTVAYDERQAVLAQLLGATVFGMISGQWLGGLLADTWGWRTAFIALTLAFAFTGGLLLVRGDHGMACTTQRGVKGLVRGLRDVVGVPWARKILIITAIEGALGFSALAFIPHDLHVRFGLSMPRAGALVALYGLGGLIYSRTARGLLRRLGEPGLARLGGLATAVAFGSIAGAPSWHWVAFASLLAGFGFYALHNTLQTNATQMAPGARGTAVSLFACCLFIGQSIGVTTAAWVVDGWSAPVVFVSAGVGLLVLGFGFAFVLQGRGRP